MGQISELLRIAASWIGTAEDPRGSNNVIFNTNYYGHRVSGSAYPWCMTFQWDIFRQAGLSKLFYDGGKTASCTTLMNWAKQKGQWVTSGFKPGDVILFQFDEDEKADHVGLLERVEGDRYICIEGNTNDEVRRVARYKAVIMGAWRPAYDDDEPETGCTVELPLVNYGDVGSTVMAMQILLVGWGYKLPKYGADGEFGDETDAALRRFQRGAGLADDGVCGTLTWKELLGVG